MYYYWLAKVVKFINYHKRRIVIPNFWVEKYLIHKYVKHKYILLVNYLLKKYWDEVVARHAFINIHILGRINYIGFHRYSLYLWKDLWYLKLYYVKKYVKVNAWLCYRRYRLFNVNMVTKIARYVTYMRREWHKIFKLRLKRFKASKLYRLLYCRYQNKSLLYVYSIYLIILGSKLLLNFGWYKIYETIYYYKNNVRAINLTNHLYYISMTKWYLVYWLFEINRLKKKQIYRRSLYGKNKLYIWQMYDVGQYIEVDYLTFTSFKLPITPMLYLTHTYLFIYLHWEFINIYNWKQFY